MRQILLDNVTVTILNHYANLYGTTVKDIIYKLVYEEVKKKPYKIKKKPETGYYFDPKDLYSFLGKDFDKYIENQDETKKGFKLNRKMIIKWILNDFTKSKEIQIKESSFMKEKSKKVKKHNPKDYAGSFEPKQNFKKSRAIGGSLGRRNNEQAEKEVIEENPSFQGSKYAKKPPYNYDEEPHEKV